MQPSADPSESPLWEEPRHFALRKVVRGTCLCIVKFKICENAILSRRRWLTHENNKPQQESAIRTPQAQVVPLEQYKEALETINKQAFQIITLQQQLEAERQRTWWDKLWRR